MHENNFSNNTNTESSVMIIKKKLWLTNYAKGINLNSYRTLLRTVKGSTVISKETLCVGRPYKSSIKQCAGKQFIISDYLLNVQQ